MTILSGCISRIKSNHSFSAFLNFKPELNSEDPFFVKLTEGFPLFVRECPPAAKNNRSVTIFMEQVIENKVSLIEDNPKMVKNNSDD